MSDINEKKRNYEKTREYGMELFAKGMCMGEIMNKSGMTQEEIAKYREELDKDK